MARDKNPESTTNRKRAPRKTSVVPEPAPERELTQPPFVDPQQRATLIARAAYFRAMSRGFEPGDELGDWLAAEAEVDAELLRGASAGAADG
jgi:hypothetical protein